jgi:hypothetical protein
MKAREMVSLGIDAADFNATLTLYWNIKGHQDVHQENFSTNS